VGDGTVAGLAAELWDLEHNWVFAWLTRVDGSGARMKGCSIDSI
jgi:hypothetical protein